jgi:hypothetical protein
MLIVELNWPAVALSAEILAAPPTLSVELNVPVVVTTGAWIAAASMLPATDRSEYTVEAALWLPCPLGVLR